MSETEVSELSALFPPALDAYSADKTYCGLESGCWLDADF